MMPIALAGKQPAPQTLFSVSPAVLDKAITHATGGGRDCSLPDEVPVFKLPEFARIVGRSASGTL